MNAIARLLSVFIKDQRELLYAYAKTQLGQKLSGTRADITNGCVEAFENVFFGCFGRHVQDGLNTGGLYRALQSSSRFRKLNNGEVPLRGDIILSATGTGLEGTIGHVGVLDDGGKIMSNNSANGIFDEHLDISIWVKRYVSTYKMPLLFYRVLV